MKPIFKYILIGLLAVTLAGITAVGVVYANGDPPSRMEFLAEQLGLTVDELREEFHAGKTLEDLAEEAGLDLDELKESLQANWAETFKARIEEAIKNGDLTNEHADWLTEGLEKGFLGGGRWFGGHGRMGHFEGPGGEKPFGDWPHVEGKPYHEHWNDLPHCEQ